MKTTLFLIVGLLFFNSCSCNATKQNKNSDSLALAKIKIINNDTINYDTMKTDTTTYQTKKSREEYTVIKQFDIARYNKNKNNDIYNIGKYQFTDNNGMIVTQEYDSNEYNGEYYVDRRHYPNSPYTYICVYNLNGNITGYETQFYSIYIGKSYDYDTSGNMARETDEDAPYKFSLDDLILKMKREYEVDIENKNSDCIVNRYTTDGVVFYEVSLFASMPINKVYLINGDNGKTLYVTEIEIEWYPGKSEETVYQQYKRVKKIK